MSDENTEPEARDGDEQDPVAEAQTPQVDAPEQKKPKPAKAKPKKATKDKVAKAKKDTAKGKGKKAKGGGSTVASHPRAAAQVRRAKGWGGLCGFAIAAYLSYRAAVPPDQIGLRAIGAGIAGYMIAWGCTVSVWRYLLLAELRAQVDRRRQAATAAGRPPTAGSPAPSPQSSSIPE